MNKFFTMVVIFTAFGLMTGCAATQKVYSPSEVEPIYAPTDTPQPVGRIHETPNDPVADQMLEDDLNRCHRLYGNSDDEYVLIKYRACMDVAFDKNKTLVKNDQILAKTGLGYRKQTDKELNNEQKRREKTQRANNKVEDSKVKRLDKLAKTSTRTLKELMKIYKDAKK